MSADGSTGAKVLHEDSGVIETEYSCLALIAWNSEPLSGRVPEHNTLITILDGTSESIGSVVVNTADQWGPFPVTTRLYDQNPGDPGPEWEDVVEVTLTASSPVIVTELVDNEPQIELIPRPGRYRLRVSARGRYISDNGADADEFDDDAPPKEWFLLETWLAPEADPVVVRLTSSFALNQLNPPPRLLVPAGEVGLASVHIGHDVDGQPGARTQSGEPDNQSHATTKNDENTILLNSQDGAFYVFWPAFDGHVPRAADVTPGEASLHVDEDILLVVTASQWSQVEVRLELVDEKPATDPAEWQTVDGYDHWYVGGPLWLTDMEFDPGDDTLVLDTAHSIYNVLWRSRTAEFASSRGVTLPDGVAEEHEIFIWKKF